MTFINTVEFGKMLNSSPGHRAHVKFEKIVDQFGTSIPLKDPFATVGNYRIYGHNQHYFTLLFHDGTQRSCYVGNDSQIQVLDPENPKFKDIYDKMENNFISNLHFYLAHSCSSAINVEIFAVKPSGNVFPAWQQDKEANDRPAFFNFITQFNTCLSYTMDEAQALLRNAYQTTKAAKEGSKLTISSVMELGQKTLREANPRNLRVIDSEAKNVYGLKYSLPEEREVVIRGASAKPRWHSPHITQESAPTIIKTMDAVIGVACVSLLHELDEPTLRTIHALPGEYRMINGGLEYGGLSNGWMCHPFIANLVFDLSRKALALALGNHHHLWKTTEDEVVNTMLTCDVVRARAILERNKNLLYKMFRAAWVYEGDKSDKLYEILMKGVSVAVKDPYDLVTNWVLEGRWTTHCDGVNKNVKFTIPDLIKDPKFRIA